MIVNAVKYRFPADKAGEAERIFGELRAASLAEAGCLGFVVARDVTEPATFVLFEEWVDQAALDAHYATEAFERLGRNGVRLLAESRLALRGMPLA
jgi:quinol monooxygenase YgiN